MRNDGVVPRGVLRARRGLQRAKSEQLALLERARSGDESVTARELADAAAEVELAEARIVGAEREAETEREAERQRAVRAYERRRDQNRRAVEEAEARSRQNAINSGQAEAILGDLARHGSPDAARQLAEIRRQTNPSILVGTPLQDAAHPTTYDSAMPPRRRRTTMGQSELERSEAFDPDTGEAL